CRRSTSVSVDPCRDPTCPRPAGKACWTRRLQTADRDRLTPAVVGAEALLATTRAARTATGVARWGCRALTCLLGEAVRRRRSSGGHSHRVKPGFDDLHTGAEVP